MDELTQAMNGETVTIPYEDIQVIFMTDADLQFWCNLYGLQFQYLPEKEAYKISKA